MKKQDKLYFTIQNEDGDDEEIELPSRYEVCERCQGKGKHGNPNIDGNGITSSEWEEWSDEDQETYMSGGYDVQCTECHGQRVVLVPDKERIQNYGTEEQKEGLRSYYDSIQDTAEQARYCRMENQTWRSD